MKRKIFGIVILLNTFIFFSCTGTAIDILLKQMKRKVDECKEITIEMEELLKNYDYRDVIMSDEMETLSNRGEDSCSEIANIAQEIGKLAENYSYDKQEEILDKVADLYNKMVKTEEEREVIFFKYESMSE